MPNTTTNYNLTKPLETERYDVQVFNNNADIIDAAMKTNADNISNVASKVEQLNAWTTVEFSLADFTYDEDTGWSTFRIELPNGYILAEARGYYVLNNIEVNSSTTYMAIEPTTSAYDAKAALPNQEMGTTIKSDYGVFEASYNNDLSVYKIGYTHYSSTANVNWSGSPLASILTQRARSVANSRVYTNNSLTIKTNVPYTNISEFYGKLQYRVVPS